MTPAQAMHDAFWDEGMCQRKAWPSDAADQTKWNMLSERGLTAARWAYSSGKRGNDLHEVTAAALTNAYWDLTKETPDPAFDWQGFRAAFLPAARALLNMAQAQPRRAA